MCSQLQLCCTLNATIKTVVDCPANMADPVDLKVVLVVCFFALFLRWCFFCPSFKVVLVGPPGTGKSSMIHSLTTKTFKTFHSPTAFDNRTAKIEDGQNSYQLRWGVDNSYSFKVYISQCLGHRRKWRDPERHLLQGWRCDGLLSSGIWWRQSWNFEKLLRRVIPILQKDFPCWNKNRAEGCKRQSKSVQARKGAGKGVEWASLSWVLHPEQWWISGRSVQRGGQKGFSGQRPTG